MEEEKKVIVVSGATGQQGGSVARSLLKSNRYKVIALTRNPDSTAALDLKRLGAEVTKADLMDHSTLESVFKMNRVYGVFSVQNYWETMSRECEILQGQNLADAAKSAGVQHFIQSTLDRETEIPHYRAKEAVEKYVLSKGLPCTFFMPSFYYENFLFSMQPFREGDTVVFSAPIYSNIRIPFYSVSDTGEFVLHAFDNPTQWISVPSEGLIRYIGVVSEYLTMTEVVKIFSRVTGQKAKYNEIDMEKYRTSGVPGAEEFYLNFKFFIDHPLTQRDQRLTKKILPGCLTWETFLTKTGWKGPHVVVEST